MDGPSLRRLGNQRQTAIDLQLERPLTDAGTRTVVPVTCFVELVLGVGV
jgi:hypothetical protein